MARSFDFVARSLNSGLKFVTNGDAPLSIFTCQVNEYN